MSTVLKPSGPLPDRVYWFRRLVLVLVGVFVLVVAWAWFAPGRDDSSAATTPMRGSGPRQQPTLAPGSTSHTPTRGSSTGSAGPRTGSSSSNPRGTESGGRHGSGLGGQTGASVGGRQEGSPGRAASPRTPLESPTGACDPSQVQMSIDVADSVTGRPNTATLILTVPASVGACTLPITPDSLVARITSGPDIVWSSVECPDGLPAKQVVIRNDPATVYSFEWTGRRSTQPCVKPGDVAPPGGYWVEAALVGGDPRRAYFDIAPSPASRR